jgi:molybdenum cofactor guanylyltransferase
MNRSDMSNWEQKPLGLSAMVLAGGLSSRMGQDKALMMIEGMPLLGKICGIAEQCANPVFVVTPWVERYQNLMGSGVQFVKEVRLADEPNGSLVGFMQGLAQVETEWVLLLACDLPGLRLEILREWCGLLSEVTETVLLPKNPGGWWEPLCGFYHRDSWADLRAYVAAGGRSHQGWLRGRSVYELPLSDPQMLLNCNTPEDLQRFQEEEGLP